MTMQPHLDCIWPISTVLCFAFLPFVFLVTDPVGTGVYHWVGEFVLMPNSLLSCLFQGLLSIVAS